MATKMGIKMGMANTKMLPKPKIGTITMSMKPKPTIIMTRNAPRPSSKNNRYV